MTRYRTPKLGAYSALAAAGLLAALLFGKPAAVVLAIPFALVAMLGLALAAEPALNVEVRLDRDRILVGEEAVLEVRVTALMPTTGLEVTPRLADSVVVAGGALPRQEALGTGEERCIEMRITARSWGSYDAGSVLLRARDGFGLFLFERLVVSTLQLRVYPRPESVRALLAPRDTQANAGNTVARDKGDGIEFADIRRFEPGDHARHVNWRVSARRGELHVNQHHPERNTDVVIFIDTFAEVGMGRRTTLDLAVRAAASLAHSYLRTRDRVGLIAFGGVVRWVGPGVGMIQLYRLMDSLLDTRVVSSYAWKGIDVIPRGSLPAKALLLALSPLLDPRTIAALLDVRGRGFDVAVVELDPLAMVPSRGDERGEMAYRLWGLERDAMRARLQVAGIPVAGWNDERPLEAVLEEVRSSRRSARALV